MPAKSKNPFAVVSLARKTYVRIMAIRYSAADAHEYIRRCRDPWAPWLRVVRASPLDAVGDPYHPDRIDENLVPPPDGYKDPTKEDIDRFVEWEAEMEAMASAMMEAD